MSTPDTTSDIRTSPEYQVIEGDKLEARLAVLTPEAERIEEEMDAIRALLTLPSLIQSGFMGSNFTLMRVPDRHFEGEVPTGPTADVIKKCELLDLNPRIVSQFYQLESLRSPERYSKFFQLQISPPPQTDP